MPDESIRILDTGTAQAEEIPTGLEVHHQPALVRRPLDFAESAVRQRLQSEHHLVFYSRFAVEIVASRKVIVDPAAHRFWAVGRRTAQCIEANFEAPAHWPAVEQFTGLLDSLREVDEKLPIIAFGLAGVERDLSPIAGEWGVDFVEIPVYESGPTPPSELQRAFRRFAPQWLVITSSRGARSVVDALGGPPLRDLRRRGRLKIAAIGESTALTLRQLGLGVDVIPDVPGRKNMLDEIAGFSH